jgi:hypothetical protein
MLRTVLCARRLEWGCTASTNSNLCLLENELINRMVYRNENNNYLLPEEEEEVK